MSVKKFIYKKGLNLLFIFEYLILSIISLLKNNKILDIINFPIYYILMIVGIFAVTSLLLERYLVIIAIICFAVKGIYLYLLSLDKYAE